MKNWMNLTLTLSLVLSFAVSASAGKNTVEDLLEKKFSAVLKPFDSKKLYYHYFGVENNDPRLGTVEGRQAIATGTMHMRMDYFWYVNGQSNKLFMAAGAGLYTAIDPAVSQEFGNIMVQIRVNDDRNYLDLTSGTEITEDDLKGLSGDPSHLELLKGIRRLDYNFFDTMMEPLNQSIKPLVYKVLQKLGVVAVEYNYKSYLNMLCEVPISNSAMVFFGRPKTVGGTDVDMSDYKVTLVRENLENLSKDEKKDVELTLRRKEFFNNREKSPLSESELLKFKSETHDCK